MSRWYDPATERDRVQRERYTEATGKEPETLYPPGHPAHWQWAYNGRGPNGKTLGRKKDERYEALSALLGAKPPSV